MIYDSGVTLVETWRGWSASSTTASASRSADISLEKLQEIVAAARIKLAVVEVESRPYHPQSELLGFCRQHGIVLLAFAALVPRLCKCEGERITYSMTQQRTRAATRLSPNKSACAT